MTTLGAPQATTRSRRSRRVPTKDLLAGGLIVAAIAAALIGGAPVTLDGKESRS